MSKLNLHNCKEQIVGSDVIVTFLADRIRVKSINNVWTGEKLREIDVVCKSHNLDYFITENILYISE